MRFGGNQTQTRRKGGSSLWIYLLRLVIILALLAFPILLLQYALDNQKPAEKKIFHTFEYNEEPDARLERKEATKPPTISIIKSSRSVIRHIDDSAQEQTFVIRRIEDALRLHPFHSLTAEQKQNFSLEEYFVFLSKQSQCENLPIFTSMANIFSELYWQLVENFVYSMAKFDLSSCSIMICVSDLNCMKRCQNSYFPCILFDYEQLHPGKEKPSALEQIAELKLLHLPKAFARGVNMIILDSDVGFLNNPMNLLNVMDKSVDMYVQKDISYVMNRTLIGWKTWYTLPLPNIGIFYIKGNKKTTHVFREAWRRYNNVVDPKRRNNPGKDQIQVALAMRYTSGLKWAYFPASSAVLLDMVYKFNDPRYELGGTAALSIFQPSNKTNAGSNRHKMGEETKDVGQVSDLVNVVHTTCYEQKNKVNGLKAANAFWNPYYYNVTRRTLTKKIIYFSPKQLLNEVRTLLYLGYITDRSVIIPNILSDSSVMHKALDLYNSQSLWPFFRSLFLKPSLPLSPPLSIIEPAYYWRIERDYFENKSYLLPQPYLLPLYHAGNQRRYPMQEKSKYSSLRPRKKPLRSISVQEIEAALLSPTVKENPRVVISMLPSIYSDEDPLPVELQEERKQRREEILQHHYDWALDSVGKFLSFPDESEEYEMLPPLNQKGLYPVGSPSIAKGIVVHTRLCDILFRFDNGNRSCFNKCH